MHCPPKPRPLLVQRAGCLGGGAAPPRTPLQSRGGLPPPPDLPRGALPPAPPRQGAPPPGPLGEKSRFYGELVLTGMQKTTFLENCNPVRIPLRQDPTVGSGFLGPPVLRTKTDPCSGKHPKYTSVSPEISNGFNKKSNLNTSGQLARRGRGAACNDEKRLSSNPKFALE